MKEIRDLASGMREAIASIRKSSGDAKSGLHAEIERANVNAGKIKSFTAELKEANLEVEAFLGETGSNFPTSEDSNTQEQTGHKLTRPSPVADRNGVVVNKED